jgi:hypothetical protein
MEESKDYFLDLAYSFYPAGISYNADEEAYFQTPEYQRLAESLRQRAYLDRKWKALLNVLQTRFECQNIGVPDSVNRCLQIAIVLRQPKRHAIIVNVSKLIPYYCFYTQTDRDDIQHSQPGYFIFTGFTLPDQEVVEWTSKRIQDCFEGYKEFPSDLHEVEIENVEFEDNGKVLSDQYRMVFKPMTLFNAFFSLRMFY